MMTRFLCLLLLSLPVWAQHADPQRYIHDVQTLAAPKMEGRGAGTKGIGMAREYIRKQFAALGLKPAGDNGTYLQSFTVTTGAKLTGKNHLKVDLNGARSELTLNQDYVPFSFSSSGEVSGPVVFGGYGITAASQNYDDYLHFDVKDKIVVLLRYEPTSFSKTGGQTEHARLINKAINARNHGAKAIVIVNGRLEPKEDDLLPKFGSMTGPDNSGIMIVQAKNAVVDQWLKSAGASLAEVQKSIDDKSEPKPMEFKGLNVTVQVGLQRIRSQVSNVVAYLPGKTDEYIILGAHYDHLGYGGSNSLAPSMTGTIHPGADDNASGSSGLLELARIFTAENKQRERGILFIAFSGEEIGLLGSAEWTNHPTLPLEKADAMINMDMIGRMKDDRIFVGGIGSGSTFKATLDGVNGRHPLRMDASGAGSGSSDHVSFIAKQIPSLFFFSGLHGDYHKPSDTADKIDGPSTAKLLDTISDLTDVLADGERPKFIKVEEPRPVSGSRGGGYGPWFGSVPDFGEEPRGVKFADVRPNSPAEKAGLKAGDIMTQFGDKPVKNLYDFTFALGQYKIGDVVEVTVLRDNKPMTVKVTLEQRK